MAWNPPSDADLAPDEAAQYTFARRIRDLSAALAERASGSPWLNAAAGQTRIFNIGFGGILGSPPEKAGERTLIGSWAVPDGVYRIDATLIGGGGAGGQGKKNSGTSFLPTAGGGGGAGAVARYVLEVEPGQVFGIVLGAGGRTDLIDPSVDTSLDGFEIGDGARTTFGVLLAGGGRRGRDGDGSLGTGAGAGAVGGQNPTIYGADGGVAINLDTGSGDVGYRSGRGASTIFGGGGPGRHDPGDGYGVFFVSPANMTVPGAGGGGGLPAGGGGTDTKEGGRGGHGAVIVRY
jgi:hypothetical protein